MINVIRSSMPSFEEYCEEIRELWDSRWLTNSGAKHQELEAALKEYLGVPALSLFANGHMALEYALAAMELPAGGEVITTPFTFASTTHAITRCGLVPVFCDINDRNFTIDADKIEALITEKTCAIMPVHVYGSLCDTEAIAAIAARYGLKVIYDAAHAFGVFSGGVSSACFGDAAMFSFHATKAFHSVEGGAVCCSDPELAERMNRLKNFGIVSPEQVSHAGGNGKMSEFHAAMGLCNLRHFEDEVKKRRQHTQRYINRLSGAEGLRLMPSQPGVTSNHTYFPVVFDGYKLTRDEAAERLAARGINARKYFYPLTSDFDCYRSLPTAQSGSTPIARHISDRILCLPMYADLRPEDVELICDIIME